MVRFGDLSGKGIVYDDEGRLIPKLNERILHESMEQNIYAKRLAPRQRHSRIFEPSKEEGFLYITDERMVFIRKPDAWRAAWLDLTPVGLSAAVAKGLAAKDLKALKACRYLEIPYKEVVSFVVPRGKYATIIAADSSQRLLVEVYRKNRDDRKLSVLQRAVLEGRATSEMDVQVR